MAMTLPPGEAPALAWPAMRRVGPADAAAPALAALHAAAFPPAMAWGAEAIGLMLAMPGAFALWLPEAGFVLVRAAGGEAEILTLAVVPDQRRRGLATALMTVALAQCHVVGADAVFLEVAATNAAALALYGSLGFRPVGRRPRYYADGTDALVLRHAARDASAPAANARP